MHQANHGIDNSEELPFQCDICKKGFMKEEFLNTHKVRHRVKINQRAASSPETVATTASHVNCVYTYFLRLCLNFLSLKVNFLIS